MAGTAHGSRHAALVGIASALLISLTSGIATAGGYYQGTKGARATGRGGAFTAKADDLSAVALNPAGLTHIKRSLVQVGNRFSYNAHVFQRAPTLDWGALEGGVPPYVEFPAERNETPWQLLDPIVGAVTSFGLEDFAFAVASYSPPGVSRQEFPVDGGQRYMMVSREALIVHHTANVAYEPHPQFGLGVSLQWITVPKLDYQLVIDANQFPGRANPVSSEFDMLSTIRGSDPFTFNAILGAWYRPVPYLEIGISGQVIPTEIKTDSRLGIEPLASGIDDEVELTRDSEPADDVHLTLPLPLTARLGVRYRHLVLGEEVFDIELDLAYESWSRVERFTLDGDGLIANLFGQRVDVGLIEVEKQWRDTFSVQLGSDVAVHPEWLTLRGGAFYESAMAHPAYANVDFVSSSQLGGALGFSAYLGDFEVAVAQEYRHQPRFSVTEGDARIYQQVPASSCEAPFTNEDLCNTAYLGRPAPPVNAGSYRAFSHVTSLDVLYRF